MIIYPTTATIQQGGMMQFEAWCLPTDYESRLDLALLGHEMLLTGLMGRRDYLSLTAPEFRTPYDDGENPA